MKKIKPIQIADVDVSELLTNYTQTETDVSTLSADYNHMSGDIELVNLFPDGQFKSGITGWTGAAATLSGGANDLVATGTGANTWFGGYRTLTGYPNPIPGHTYYVRAKVWIENSGASAISLLMWNSSPYPSIVNPAANVIYTLSDIGVCNSSAPITIDCEAQYSTAAATNGKVLHITDVMAIDVTEKLINGAAPTKSSVDALMDKHYAGFFDGFQKSGLNGFIKELEYLAGTRPLTNLVNGSFEGGLTAGGWAVQGNVTAYPHSGINNTPSICTTSDGGTAYASKDGVLVPRYHRVYVTAMMSVSAYTSGAKSMLIAYNTGTWDALKNKTVDINKAGWQRVSMVVSCLTTGFRILVGRGDVGYEQTYIDDVNVIDLTEAYGHAIDSFSDDALAAIMDTIISKHYGGHVYGTQYSGIPGRMANEFKYNYAYGSNTVEIHPNVKFKYTPGRAIRWVQGTTNTGAVTLNVDYAGAIALTDYLGANLASGALVANKAYEAYVAANGASFILKT